MDIRKPEQSQQNTSSEPQAEQGGKFTTGAVNVASPKTMIPPAIQTKLTALGSKYGVPFDLSNIALDGKMAQNVKAIRKVADMVSADSKLLPEMLKQIKRLMRAEIKLAEFYKALTKASIDHQEKLDRTTADIFLMMAGYKQRTSKLEHRTNVRNALKEKRAAAYQQYYDQTVFAEESKLIDVEFEVLESNKKILSEGKQKRIQFNQQRQKAIADYVQSAYQE